MRELGDDFGNLARREELAGLLPSIGGKALDQEDVGVAQDVFGDLGKIEPRLGEVLQQHFQPSVTIFGLAQIGFGVEVDGTEQAAELSLVGLFDRIEHDIDQFANVVPRAPLIKAVEVAEKALFDLVGLRVFQLDRRQLEALAIEAALDAKFVAAIFAAEFLNMLAAHVADVFQEQRGQHVVLVLRRIDRAAKRVACAPDRRKNVFLPEGRHCIYCSFYGSSLPQR